MCTYCGTTQYHKIYINHYGPIPKDPDGRTYEIHHIDGNHSNNTPTNLTAVTLQEHYNIHYAQGDYRACQLMAIQRMDKTPEEISELASKANLKRVKDGKHHFQRRADGTSLSQDKVADGTHHMMRPDNNAKLLVESGNHHFIINNPVYNQLIKGTHPFLQKDFQKRVQEKRIKSGTHNFLKPTQSTQYQWTCPHCNKTGRGKGNYTKHHGTNCKSLGTR